MEGKPSPHDAEGGGDSIDALLDDESYAIQRHRRHNIFSIQNREPSKSTVQRNSDADSTHVTSDDEKNGHDKKDPKDPANFPRRDKSASVNTVIRKDLEIIGENFAREKDLQNQAPGGHRISVQVNFEKQNSFGSQTSLTPNAKQGRPDRLFKSFASGDPSPSVAKGKVQRKGSFGSKPEPKEESSGLLYDYVLHHSELGTASTKIKGKILVNSYFEMDNLKSDNISHYLKIMKDLIAGKELTIKTEPAEKKMDKIPEENAKAAESGSENNSQDEHSFHSEKSDQGNQGENIDKETLDLLENYVEEQDEEEEEEKSYSQKEKPVKPHDNDNNEEESRELAPREMFMKFNGKEAPHKKAKRLKPSQPIVFRKPAQVIETNKIIKQAPSTEPIRTDTQPKSEIIAPETPKSQTNKEQKAVSMIENSLGLTSSSAEQGGNVSIDQINKQDEISEPLFELKKEHSEPVLTDNLLKEEAASNLDSKSLTDLPSETEDIFKKSTIRVLSKFDQESSAVSSTGLTLEKVVAKNAGKGRDRGKSIEPFDVPKDTPTPDSIKTSDPNLRVKNITRIPVPEDPLDKFDTQDQGGVEMSVNTNVADSLVVTQNPLFSSYKLKITDITICKTLSQTLCDSITTKKTHEPTVIKFAPPDYIFVGTNLSTILVYDNNEHLKQTIKYNEGPKQAVTAIDYSLEDPELHVLIVGFSGGYIAIYDLKNFNCLKTITDVQTSKISCLKIYQGNTPLKFLSCDESGEIFSFTVQKVLWLYKETHNLILKESDTFTFDVEVIPKDIRILNAHTLQDQEYLKNIWFLSKIDNIMVMNVNKDNDHRDSHLIEWSFERPPNVGPECLPSISIGKGGLIDNKKKSYLLIGWGQFLNLINFSFNGLKISFTFEGYFELEGNILASAWIADDTAVAMDDKNMVYFINIEEFIGLKTLENNNSEGNSEDPSKPKFDSKSFMYKFALEKGLKTSVTYVNNKKIHWKPFKNAVSVSAGQHQMLMACEDKVSKVKIVSALEYLDLLLNDNEWLKFLTIGLQIYHHNLKEFHGVPLDIDRRKKLFIPYFQEKITKYVDDNVKAGARSERYYREVILSLIDFLVELDDLNLLFGHCYKKICEASLQKLFIELLEPFIALNKIKYVPDDLLKTIITHYCLNGKSHLMQKLISNLDLSKQDCFILIHLCLEHNLYTALINVCANTEEDFLTPFIKQLNDYRSAKHSKNEEEAQKYGYRCLWYLRLCMEKRIVSDNDEESFEKWKKIMNQLMVMVFEPENLRILYETDGDLTTCFVMLFFIGDLAALVEESYGSMKFGNTKQGDSAGDNVHFQIYATVKQVLNNWPGPEKKTLYVQYFGFFVGILAHLMRYSFLDRDLCVYFADLYISQPTLLSEKLLLLWEKIRLRKEGKTNQEIKNYFKEKIDYDFIFEQRVGVILDLLKYCQFTLTKDQISELIKKSQASHLIDVECFLLAISWDYKGCFNIYLKHQGDIESQAKVFDWTFQTFKQYVEKVEKNEAEKKAIEELKFAIINRMPTLIAIDGEQSILLVETYLSDKLLYVLNNLEFRPDLKLKILEKYMKKQDESFEFDEKLLILYIKLLAQADKQHRKKIKSIIQSSNKYPIAACLEICRKYDIKDVWAYLEVKQGKIENAINISYELLEDTLDEIFIQKTEDNREEISENLNHLVEYLNQNTHNSEETWFQNLIKVYKFYEENKDKVKPEVLEREFLSFKTMIMDQMVEDILRNFDSRTLMRTIESMYDDFPLVLRRNLTIKILTHNVHEEFVLSYCKTLLCEDILNFININLLPIQLRGNFHLPCCETCQRGFRTYEYVIWFGCGHLYHSTETCCPGFCPVCQHSGSNVVNIVHQKISRGSKTQAPKNIKLSVEEELPDHSRSRVVTRSLKDNQDQYYNEKADKLNRYWKNKAQKQSELNDFTEKYL